MKSHLTINASAGKTSFWHYLSLGGLGLAALWALHQDYRMRRSVAEMTGPDEAPLPEPAPHVSIILPVRDEEQNIDACLASLLDQDYPNFDVTVIDDGSTDATPRLLAAWTKRDPRVHVHRIDALPPGWAGKAHALHTGVGLTDGEWLLFTDADTRHEPQTLRLMLGHALRHNDDFLSMFTDMEFIGPGMHLLTPVCSTLMVELATPAEARKLDNPYAIAVGQYILLRRAAYLETGGYAAPELRSTYGEDVALAEYFKRHGKRADVVGGRGLVKNRQWTTWESAWRGWGKSVYSVLALKPLLGLGGLGLIFYGLGPLFTLIRSLRPGRVRPLAALLSAITLAAQIDTKRRFDREFDVKLPWSLLAPFGWAAYGLLLLDTARLALTGRGATWKDRPAPRQAMKIGPIAAAEVVRGQHHNHTPVGAGSQRARSQNG